MESPAKEVRTPTTYTDLPKTNALAATRVLGLSNVVNALRLEGKAYSLVIEIAPRTPATIFVTKMPTSASNVVIEMKVPTAPPW